MTVVAGALPLASQREGSRDRHRLRSAGSSTAGGVHPLSARLKFVPGGTISLADLTITRPG
jgi:hypothetical protein